MANRDLKLLNNIKSYGEEQIPKYLKELGEPIATGDKIIEHPLDKDVLEILNKFEIRTEDDDYRIFYYLETIKNIWKIIIDKSIKCLRYFDKREPFLENTTKRPVAYGVNELSDYFEEYSKFESMLYGGGKYYRDHVVHVFRVWMLGLDILLDNDGKYLDKITIEEGIEITPLEKLSIWSMIALTHDLGYPLEKSQEIIDKTKNMMKSFVTNPIVSMDLSFNGVQNNMNDVVLRFISSKMHKVNTNCPKQESPVEVIKKEKNFVARLQQKYYFKLQKSLEKSKHGVLSSIIIYKLLLYFLESDYSINEDYRFSDEDVRQFYIRREILRSVASHTCHDIYHLDMLSFAYLLIIADDSQEWGRKRIAELYVKSNSEYEFKGITPNFDVSMIKINGEEIPIHECLVSEQFRFQEGDTDNLKRILKNLQDQSESYKEIFRDGQDTSKRNFVFRKQCSVIYDGNKASTFIVEFKISNEEKATFTIKLKADDIQRAVKEFDVKFFEKIYSRKIIQNKNLQNNEVDYCVEDANS